MMKFFSNRKALEILLIWVSVLCQIISSVDRSNFKTCDQSSFCSRHRALTPGESTYELLLNTLKTSDLSVNVEVINKIGGHFLLELFPLKDSTLRIKLNEKTPIYQRFEEPYALLDNIKAIKYSFSRTAEGFTIQFGDNKAIIYAKPLKIDIYQENVLAVTINALGLLKFEHYRKPKHAEETPNEEGNEIKDHEEEGSDDEGLWEETFKGHVDSKPRGPASLGIDIAFINSKHVYGIPEHADSLKLKETQSGDPYRLYNLDVFEYELDNPMALYGSIPVMISHSSKITTGIFWHNAAETWVDIKNLPAANVVSSITGLFSGSEAEIPHVSTHWMSESGIMDLFVMLGNKPMDVFRQYSLLTGTTPLPPLFSLGYHQCRWNYNDEKDVQEVHEGFDKHNIPLDVLWLDIEHTDGKRYFTWDQHKFPNPIEMTANLTARGRKLVTIVDPHIKKDSNYFFYQENHDLDFYIKTKDGDEFDGWCWPGTSSYIDFTNPDAREHYINTFSLDRYKGSTLDTFTWNDMNEPSVFNGPEVTMQKDTIHPGLGIEHRDLHNVNGLLFHSATYEGLVRRSGGKLRPFVLTRAHYAGTQRTASVWTGDNHADYGHLRISVPMVLSESIVGITQIGADIGGFFGNPDEFLLTRWYQIAAYTTFFRAHAHIDTKRREPWLFGDTALGIIRDVIKTHYRLLPYMYTLFYENELTGAPPLRPLWVEFPSDENTFDIDYEFLLGSGLLIRPVVDEGATTAAVYFPHGSWFDIDDYTIFTGPKQEVVNAPREKIPVYQRGGSVIARKMRARRSSVMMRDDPYTLFVALDVDGNSQGALYIDDEHTFDYTQGKFLYLGFSFAGGLLTSKIIDPNGSFNTKSWLERVIIIGLTKEPSKVTMESVSGKNTLDFQFEKGNLGTANVLTIRKPGINMAETFSLRLH